MFAMGRSSRLALFGVMALATATLFAAVACSDDDDGDTTADGGQVVAEAGGDDHDAAQAEAQDVAVVALDSFAYDPTDLSLVVGHPVRITLDNGESTLLHDFTVEGLSAEGVHSEGAEHDGEDEATTEEHEEEHGAVGEIHVATGPGETGIVEFTPTESGDYVFYCTVAGHREAGMEGTITVVEE